MDHRGQILRRSMVPAICLLLVAGLLLATGCSRQNDADQPTAGIGADEVPEAATAVVTRRSFEPSLRLGGTIEAPTEVYAEVGCALCPPVAEALVSVGDSVQAGDPLVRMQGDYPAEVVEALEQELAAERELMQRTRTGLDQAVDEARAEYEALEQRLRELESGSDAERDDLELRATRTALARAQSNVEMAVAAREELLSAHEASVAQLEAELEVARSGRAGAVLASPIDGEVIAVNADPGEPADAAPLVTVAQLVDLHLKAFATPLQAHLVRPGLEAIVRLTTRDEGPFEGETLWVTPPLEQEAVTIELPEEGAHLVLIAFENTGGIARPNDPAEAIIQFGEVDNALTIPSGAIDWDRGVPWVNLQSGDEFVRRPIVVGPGDLEWTVAEDGLRQGDVIAYPEGVRAVRGAPAT